MTREEIVKFVEYAIYKGAFPAPVSGPMRDSIEKIADRWEEDINEAREDSIVDGRESVEPEIVDYETIYRFSGD